MSNHGKLTRRNSRVKCCDCKEDVINVKPYKINAFFTHKRGMLANSLQHTISEHPLLLS